MKTGKPRPMVGCKTFHNRRQQVTRPLCGTERQALAQAILVLAYNHRLQTGFNHVIPFPFVQAEQQIAPTFGLNSVQRGNNLLARADLSQNGCRAPAYQLRTIRQHPQGALAVAAAIARVQGEPAQIKIALLHFIEQEGVLRLLSKRNDAFHAPAVRQRFQFRLQFHQVHSLFTCVYFLSFCPLSLTC